MAKKHFYLAWTACVMLGGQQTELLLVSTGLFGGRCFYKDPESRANEASHNQVNWVGLGCRQVQNLVLHRHDTDLDVKVIHHTETASVEPACRDMGVKLGHPGFGTLRIEKNVNIWACFKSG